MTADLALTAALRSLAEALDELGTPAMVIGGIAVIARGVPRTTLDIDATVWAVHLDLGRAVEVFGRHGFAPRVADAQQFAEDHQVILLRHEASGTPLDVSLARLPFERDALARAEPVNFGGPTLLVTTVEDLVVYKAVAWRERDRSDIERLLVTHPGEVNVGRVRALVAEFAVALDAPERVAEFDALLARVSR
jgi:Nucleotidyltransferase of unknown function (DUF6036)